MDLITVILGLLYPIGYPNVVLQRHVLYLITEMQNYLILMTKIENNLNLTINKLLENLTFVNINLEIN